MDNKDIDKKYPKSKNGFQCLGPCVKKDTLLLHPLTLAVVTDDEINFCNVNEWRKDNKSKYIDECDKLSKNTEYDKNDILLPIFYFDSRVFLDKYYNISSFKDTIEWINNNKNNPYNTIKRILNCSWGAYGKDIKYVYDDIVDIHLEIAKKEWIIDIYQRVNKYITVKNNKVMFRKSNMKGDNIKEKIRFLTSKLITPSIMAKFLKKYIDSYKNKWDNIELHMDNIKEEFINYIEKKITTILKK